MSGNPIRHPANLRIQVHGAFPVNVCPVIRQALGGQGRLARNSDHRADDLDTDNTGGVLSGLLAEEEDLDRRALWRLGSWGVGAVVAVIVAVMANQTQLGWKRDQMASADLSRQTQQVQMAARENQNEARRLASAIDTLNSDRDRLYARVTGLEQGLDSVTGAIARQGSTAPVPPTPLPAAEPQPAQGPAPAVAAVAATPAGPSTSEKPAVAPPSEPASAAVSSIAKDPPKESARDSSRDLAKTEIPKADSKKADAAKSETAKSETAKPETARTEAAKVDITRASDVTPATPLMGSKSFMAPPDPAAAKLTDPAKPLGAVTASPIPEVVASAPVSDAEADEETAPKVAIQRTQFGVDLGTANSVPGLRVLWRGLQKSRSNASLAALRPIIVIKEGTNGLGMQLRLVAGPLNDAGAAARICAVLAENKRNCETAIFDGQRLSVTGDDPAPPSSKPSQRRRGANKRVTAVVEEPPKKPERSTTAVISSWLGKRGQ